MWEKTRTLPLHTLTVEVLSKHQSSISDEDLFEELKRFHEDLSMEALRKTLFKLEVEGVVRVTSLTKNRKRIELTR